MTFGERIDFFEDLREIWLGHDILADEVSDGGLTVFLRITYCHAQ